MIVDASSDGSVVKKGFLFAAGGFLFYLLIDLLNEDKDDDE